VNMPLLVRHPVPYPTESLLGYVLRVSEGNGYSSLPIASPISASDGKRRVRQLDYC
jgi:hypothetical protein